MTDHASTILLAPQGQGGNHTPDAPQGARLFLSQAMRKTNNHAALRFIMGQTTAQPVIGPRRDHTALQPAPALACGGA